MASTGDTADAILSRFSYQTLPRIVGIPTYNSITLAHNDLKANAASIPSELGGGALGHLALTVPPAVYATLSNVAFIVPNNPGPIAPVLAVAPTAAQLAAHRERFTEELRIYRLYNNVQNVLKTQLLAAVEDIYVRTLRNTHTGYAQVTVMQLLDHLYTTYGRMTPMALQDNDIRFRQAYNPAEPFELLIQQIEDAMSFAAAGNQAYTAEQVVSNAYYLIHSTGMFIDACREWRRRTTVTKTWANFKTDFAQAHTELGEMNHTSQAAGYHNANNAVANFVNDTGDALANLATATAADRDMLRSLQATNEALLTQQAVKDAELTQLRQQLQQFQAGMSNRTNNNNNRRGNNAGRSNNTNNNNQTYNQNNNPNNNQQYNQNNNRNNNNNNAVNNPGTGQKRYPNMNYCWTHGYDVDPRHDSSNCRNPANGHQHGATRNTPMGGSEAGKARSLN
jgi:hypothetical protein